MKSFIITLLLVISHISYSQVQTGKASFYADKFNGKPTASGEIYKHNKPTAAHRKLPFGTKVEVTNLSNNKTAIVTINDRGPFIRGRIIDLSRSVAESLDIIERGVIDVQIEVLSEKKVRENEVKKDRTNEHLSPTVIEKEKPQEANDIVTKESTAENFETPSKNTIEEEEFYELTANRVEPDFYGIQIASFHESENIIHLANKLKLSYKSEVLIQIKSIEDTKVYKVILGQFKNRTNAENFKSKNLKEYPDAFIVDMTRKD